MKKPLAFVYFVLFAATAAVTRAAIQYLHPSADSSRAWGFCIIVAVAICLSAWMSFAPRRRPSSTADGGSGFAAGVAVTGGSDGYSGGFFGDASCGPVGDGGGDCGGGGDGGGGGGK
jgi:hypothetical protein